MISIEALPGWTFSTLLSRRQASVPAPRIYMALVLGAFTAVNGQGQKSSCLSCHARQAASQPSTPMGRALLPAGHNPTLESRRDLSVTRGKFTYRIETRGGVSQYSVTDGERSITDRIEWTFGVGAQTYVLKQNGELLESMVSYYPEISGLDVTIGDNSLEPQTLEEAAGRKLSTSDVASCFGCHSTNSSSATGQLQIHSLSPGVTCEHCHQGAQAHADALTKETAAAKIKSAVPEKLRRRSAESISDFCGQCHRSWETVVRNNWRGPINVRFQPYRLANSRCFDGTDARISCLACHNPHEDVVRVDTAYDAKCTACHASGLPAATRACPVAQSRCVTCHMPKVRLPGGHQTFTDHYIRVVKPGEPYPN